VESIHAAGGAELHATGLAKEGSARDALRNAVRRRARSTDGVSNHELLVSGRWSLVDRFDSDGKHLVIAYRNPQGVVDRNRLTSREFDVVGLAATGLSNKEIGSELGISVSTAGSLVSNCLKKLKLRSRVQIPSFWRATVRESSLLRIHDKEELRVFADVPAPEPSCAGLTPAERAVVQLVLTGANDREVAARRGVSTRTVAHQLSGAFRKLGVSARAELSARVGGSQLLNLAPRVPSTIDPPN
jgi:DNA-binding NarL/FixJ family response regulator